jgi:hypothetical protein
MKELKKIGFVIGLLCCHVSMFAQEFNCKAIVMAEQIQGIDPKVFKTLELGIQDFVNNRKWTNDNFDNKEKIECVFTLVLNRQIEGVEGGYQGKLNIQSSRPIFNTTYSSTMCNYADNDVSIKYIQFQQLEFNDNRVAGNDPLVSNLTAIISYYCYFILGLDYDSYALKGGSDYFAKAQNIVNNAPEQKVILGWKATENQRNRFWLIDQVLNVRFAEMRTIFYKYHRLGMDMLAIDPEEGRNTINTLFPILEQINLENPSSALMRFFFYAKTEEIQQFLAKTNMVEKQKIIPILAAIDVSNAGKYLALMK